MEEIKERLKIIVLTFLDAIERFWDNRFRTDEPSNETIYLRMEVDKYRREYYELAKLFTAVKDSSESDSDADSELKPIGGRPHWRVEANRLTQESIRQKRLMDEQAKNIQNATRSVPVATTAELEIELLKAE